MFCLKRKQTFFILHTNPVPTPSSAHILSTFPPTPPSIQDSEKVRHIALKKVQGPPYYMEAEQENRFPKSQCK